jgi:hypothetical protein
MTQRFEKRLPNTSYGVHDAETAAQAAGMTLEELERWISQAIVDDYQRDARYDTTTTPLPPVGTGGSGIRGATVFGFTR